MALARGVDAVEQLEEALARELGQRLTDRLADDIALGDQLLVGGVGGGEDVLRSFELGHEGGRILEHLRQTLALRRGRALGQHALGGFDHNGNHAARLAILGDHRRVEEIHPAALGRATAIEDQLAVLVLQRAASHADRHDMAVEVGHFWPGVEHGRPRIPGCRSPAKPP